MTATGSATIAGTHTIVRRSVTVAKTVASVQNECITSTAGPQPSAAKVLLSASGDGDGVFSPIPTTFTPDFTTYQTAWSVAYTYNCADADDFGNFIVEVDNDQGDYDDPVNDLGPMGAATFTEQGAGTFYLQVQSECAWTVTVSG